MQFRRHQLANGLEILAECNPGAHAMACGFFVRTGSRDETQEIGGVSHFLEHMVFKGTPNRSAEQVNRELDEMGSHSNARTGEESTIYHAAVLPDFQSGIVEVLSDIMRPSLRADDFEMEKQVIIEEIKMYDDQPPYGGHERIMAEYFGDHPLGQSVLGTEQTVGDMSPERMLEYFKLRYSPGNIAFAAAGRVDFDRLVEDCEKRCGGWENFSTDRSKRPASPRSGFVSMHKPESTQQYIIQLAKGAAADDEDRFAARVLTTILGDDSGSRVYWEFLDTGLAEAAGMGNYEYDGAGLVMTFLCCDPEQAQDNIDRLAKLQRNVHQQPISLKELEQAKRKISAHIILGSERTESRMFSIGGQWLKQQPYRNPGEIAALYENVTLEQVNAAAEKYQLLENMTLCVGSNPKLVAATE